MDARHKWVIPRIAELFHCKLEDFEQFVSDQGLESEMTKFFQDPNQKKMLFYQQGEAPFELILFYRVFNNAHVFKLFFLEMLSSLHKLILELIHWLLLL